MKVESVLDYFGPRFNCNAEFRLVDQNQPYFITDGTEFSDDEFLLNGYVQEISIKDAHTIEFVFKA